MANVVLIWRNIWLPIVSLMLSFVGNRVEEMLQSIWKWYIVVWLCNIHILNFDVHSQPIKNHHGPRPKKAVTSCLKALGGKREFRGSRVKAQRGWEAGGSDKSESAVLTSDPPLLGLSNLMICCDVFMVKQQPGTMLAFRKRRQWRHSGT